MYSCANDQRHMLQKHDCALCSLFWWLLVHQSEHCFVLHRTTILDPTQVPYAQTFAVMLNGNRTAPHHGVMRSDFIVFKRTPSLRPIKEIFQGPTLSWIFLFIISVSQSTFVNLTTLDVQFLSTQMYCLTKKYHQAAKKNWLRHNKSHKNIFNFRYIFFFFLKSKRSQNLISFLKFLEKFQKN